MHTARPMMPRLGIRMCVLCATQRVWQPKGVETAPANVSHPWTPRTLPNDTTWHSYMFNWDYPLALPYIDLVTNMATYPMMHTTDGDYSWCANFPNTTWCHAGVEDFVDHLTPAYKYMVQLIDRCCCCVGCYGCTSRSDAVFAGSPSRGDFGLTRSRIQ